MTKKDYYLIVKVLMDLPRVASRGKLDCVPYDALVGAMCREFEQDNERFNRRTFVAACYPNAKLDDVLR